MTETPYRRAQTAGQDAVRRTVLDAASALLVAEGPQSLTMRRIAGEVGCSTTVLYTMFGGKDGLAEALYREGFARLRQRLVEAVERAGDDPGERLAATGRAYRENALAERSYYGVMFGQAIPGFVPSPEAVADSKRAFEVLDEAVDALRTARPVPGAHTLPVARPAPEDAGLVDPTNLLWATAHGVVSFELAGHYPDEATAAATYRTALTAVSVYLGLR
ncbi:TetR/AcrR family transcriptional regulator [Cryptosporangium aurantiacum]|uniref:Transcriptional regulator, TetR family n=1 Tax=Cryptosporangium aurantiacum TaxID=134849 RepID=A0A1M7RH59_9ACTN|nr:TetR/AcrR family transcriptional regulator [Cryptosporangium aurantiacum]SHN45378.1 transcriptional regulator, TetR family [Cryptosporangium aurantiacum]